MKKKTKRIWLIILIIVLAIVAFLGIMYYRISTNPAGMFENAATPAPVNRATTTMAPLIPIVRPTEAP